MLITLLKVPFIKPFLIKFFLEIAEKLAKDTKTTIDDDIVKALKIASEAL